MFALKTLPVYIFYYIIICAVENQLVYDDDTENRKIVLRWLQKKQYMYLPLHVFCQMNQ